MRKIYFLFLVFICGLKTIQAEPIDTTIAKQLAFRFYQQKANSSAIQREVPKIAQCAKAQINMAGTRRAVNKDCFYVVNFTNGFVIIAADDRVEPILAYSTTSTYNPREVPANIAEWMEGYRQEIAAALATNRSANAEVSEQWYKLKHNINETSRSAVAPLLQTTWSQSPYYNQYCPSDPESSSGHALTGCVATAMAQVIRYWQYPSVGLGSHSYSANNHIYSSSYGDYGTLSANFGATTYNYSLMPNSLSNSSTAEQIDAVATLLYHCGVSVEMMYGPSASGASTTDIPYALEHYFAYPAGIQYLSRSSYSDNAWSELIKNELNNMRPVVYNGHGTGGHAFVCDGYDGNLFHFNWGWGGYADGYFSLSNLNPGANNFNESQGVVTGISAASPYIRCGSNTLTIFSPVGGVSEVEEVEVRGHMLSSNISVTVNGHFSVGNTAISLGSSTTLPQDGGTLYVQYLPTTSVAQTEQGYITLSSGNVHDTIILYGTAHSTLCFAPTNLTPTINASNVTLNWTAPIQNSIAESTTISWDSSMNYQFSIGNNQTYCMLQRFEVSDLSQFNQHYLNAISFIPRAGITHCRIVAYQGGSCTPRSPYYNFTPGEQIINQEVSLSELNENNWNSVRLSNPFIIDNTKELWFGVIACVEGGYIINTGTATYVAHKGGLIASYSGNYNENETFYFNEMSDFSGGQFANNILLKASIEKIVSQVDHYEIYRDHIHLGNVTSTSYVDSITLSNPCQYTVYAVNNNYCTSEASITAYPTIPCLPSVIIGEMVQENNTTIHCNGTVTHNGNSNLSERGFCWSTSHNPTISDDHISAGNGMGNFSADPTGLTPGNTYYVRSYATNDIGTNYSDEQSITLYFVVPLSGTESYTVSSNSVLVYDNGGPDNNYSDNNGGNLILYAGGADYTFEITGTYDIENPYNENYYDELYIYDGASSSTVLAHLAGNSTISTPITSTQNAIRIYFKSDYSVNHSGFRLIVNRIGSASAPAVTTAEITNIQATTVTGGGNITADNGAAVTARGVCWSTTPNPTVGGIGCNHTSDGSGTGAFTSSITGLTPNTTYYVRAYATNSVGTSYGEPKTFKTSCNSVIATITGNNTICHGDSTILSANSSTSYLWSNHSVEKSITVSPSTSTTYSVTITNEYGCTASTSFPVIVNSTYHVNDFKSVCASELPILWNGVEFIHAGTQTNTLQTVNGCDSIVTMTLTVNPTYNVSDAKTICQSELPYTWNNVVFNTAGTQNVILQTVNGCDSVVTMTLTVNPIYQVTDAKTICQSELPYTWNNVVFNAAGTQNVTLQAVNGCDSVVTMILTVNPIYQVTDAKTICQSELPYTWNNVIFNAAGTQNVTLQAVNGCDSVVTMTLTVNPIYQVTDTKTICQNALPYVWNGVTFNTASTQEVTLQAANGCDSVVTMILTVSNNYQTTDEKTVCQSALPYVWNGVTFNTAGTQNVTLQAVNGCDSVVTMTLTVSNIYQTTDEKTVCQNALPYEWNGVTFNTASTQEVTLQAANGCDSVVTMTLTVSNIYQTTDEKTICQNALPYEWNGVTFNTAGTQEVTLQAANGCDSVVTMTLTVSNIYQTTDEKTVCQSALPYVWNGVTFNTAGTKEVTLQAANGCDSVVAMTLTVNPIYQVTDTKTICESELPYTWNNVVFNAAGTQSATLSTVNGCDSVVTMTLTVNPIYQVTDTTTICQNALPYEWNGVTFNTAGTQNVTLQAVNGCDSIVTMNLTVSNIYQTTDEKTICQNALPYEWNGVTFNTAGTQEVTLQATNGCDSVVTMTLTVNPTYAVNDAKTICQSALPYVWNGVTFNAAGTQEVTLQAANGCDSVVTMTLTVSNIYQTTDEKTICQNALPYEWNGVTFNTAGTKDVTLQAANGCDSVVTMTLTVNPIYQVTDAKTICESELPYTWNNVIFNSAGTQNVTLQTVNGCDSVVTMTLTVNPTYNVSDEKTICQSELPYTWNNIIFNAAGTQNVTLQAANGCDSVVTMTLTVNPTYAVNDAKTICESELPYTWNNVVFNAAGTQNVTLQTVNGCDSVVAMTLTVNPIYQVTDTKTICESELPYTWNNVDFNAAGTQNVTLQAANGCDSVVTMILTVSNIYQTTDEKTVCQNALPYEWNGVTFNTAGTQEVTLQAANGCDSVVAMTLTVNPIYQVTDAKTICESELPYTWNNVVFNAAGTQNVTLQTVSGCDSVVTMTLSVSNIYQTTDEKTVCQTALPYVWNGVTFNTAGTQEVTLQAANGCDSVVTMTLTVSNIYQTTDEKTICQNALPYEWNGVTFNTAGTQEVTLQAANGCDSVVTMTLSVSNIYQTTDEKTVCQSALPYEWNGVTFNTAGTQNVTLQAVNGCDSIVTMNLTVSNIYQTTDEKTVCQTALPYEWNGVTFNTAGTQEVTLQAVNGCDSVVTMTLTVSNIYQTTDEKTICQNALPYEWNGVTFNTASTQEVTLQAANGCDSVVAMTLTVNPIYQVTDTKTICESELPYTWNNVVFNAAGTQSATLSTVNGCDSVVTMTLTVNPIYQVTDTTTICQNALPYEWNGVTFNTAGTQNVTLQAVNGCDSIVTMNLTVSNIYQTTDEKTICQNALPYVWNGVTFNTAGTQEVTLQAANGCDSVVSMTLIVSNIYQTTDAKTICQNALPYEWNGVTFNTAGTQNVTLQAVNGCDSVVTMTLSVSNIYQTTDEKTVCQNALPYVWNGVTFNTAGTQEVTLQAANGCDSVVTMTLTVSNIYQTTDEKTVCQSALPYEWNGVTFNTAGTQEVTLQAANGCDSVVTMTLTVNPIYQVTDAKTICESELPYTWNNVVFNAAGTQNVTLQAVNGCDSVVTMILTVNPTYNITETKSVCPSEMPYTWNGVTFNNADIQTVTLQTVNGCDSVVTMMLTVNQTHVTNESRTICENELPYEWNGVTFNAAGMNTATLPDANGCDSNVIMTLIVNPAYAINETMSICENELPYTWNGFVFNAASTQSVTLQTVNGCDSVVTMTLTVLSGTHNVTNVTECESYTWTTGTSLTYTQSGTYIHYYNNGDNCPSADTLHLTIGDVPDIAIMGSSNFCQGSSTEIMATGAASYLWSNGSTDPIQLFDVGGTYQVVGTSIQGCTATASITLTMWEPSFSEFSITDTSCFIWNNIEYCESGDYTQTLQTVHGCDSTVTLHLTITSVGINEYHSLSDFHIIIYPNPTQNVVNVKVDDEFIRLTNSDIYDATGRRVKTMKWAEANSSQQVNMEELAPGLYFIRLFNDKQDLGIRKIIKQQ